MLAIKTDGTLWAAGYNLFGDLGQNNRIQYSSPVQIPGTDWKAVGGGWAQGIAVKTNGELWTWGTNAQGGLGQSNQTTYSSPVQIPGTSWDKVYFGELAYYHQAAIRTDGTLWLWGYNNRGQLGLNNTTNYSSPKQVPGSNWSTVSLGHYDTLATKTDGTIWYWGYNNNGQGGTNNLVQYSSPIQIPGTWVDAQTDYGQNTFGLQEL